MTRTHAIKRLLEHGPLTRKEILEIMGGSQNSAKNAIFAAMDKGLIRRIPAEVRQKPRYIATSAVKRDNDFALQAVW